MRHESSGDPNLREIITLLFVLHGSFETRDREIRLLRALCNEVRKLDPDLFDQINQDRTDIHLAELRSLHHRFQSARHQ
jgi:hypothetical protein